MKTIFKFYPRFSALLIPFFLTFIIVSCHNKKSVSPDRELPAVTTEGRNTMGALVNGQIWIPSTAYGVGSKYLCVQYSATDGLWLNLSSDVPNSQYTGGNILKINYKPLTAVGSYDLTDASKAQIQFFTAADDYTDTFTVSKGTMVITKFDLTNQIISGQFSFTAKNNRTHSIYTVTDGRFDVHTDYCH